MARRPLADQSVYSTQIVCQLEHASIRSVSIHVRALVATMRYADPLTTMPFVAAIQGIPVIHLSDVPR